MTQNQALRICCEAIKTSPAIAAQMEMGEKPLDLRYKQLMMNYCIILWVIIFKRK